MKMSSPWVKIRKEISTIVYYNKKNKIVLYHLVKKN